MNELFEKSMHTLELPAVLNMLSACAVSAGAKELCAALRPTSDRDEALRRLAETDGACKYLALGAAPHFSGVKDVGASLMRADMGGSLNPRELLDIAGVLRSARMTREHAGGGGESTAIDGLFHALQVNRHLEEKITNSIISEEEIADAASPELASIRRHIRAANDKIRSSLQKIISNTAYAKFLQEPIITIRSDRYVVPVKAECKSQIPGLVHDISSSGATVFVEPMQVVAANNEIKELFAREKLEIDRILAELSADCAACRGEIVMDYNLLVQLDFIFAKGQLSYKMNAMTPKLSDRNSVVLRRARHPLLDRKTAVPITIELGRAFDTLIITGPNTGGKTVAIKTLGLLSLMAGCGLNIPADDGSQVCLFEAVLSDIGDEQSIEQSLSTFSAHMVTIVGILKECGPGTLLLFDELGAGTDPVEGAALAVSIIEQARKTGALIAATTHYAELKVYALSTPGVENASCEFDVATLRPTYRLLIGVPGKSNAFAISRRLGLDEKIIDAAQAQIGQSQRDFEDVIDRLEQQRQQMERAKEEAEQLRRETAEINETSRKYREEIEKERRKALDTAKNEARQIIDDARAAADKAFKELNQMRKADLKNTDWNQVNQQRAKLRGDLNAASDAIGKEEAPPPPPPSSRPAKKGDTVMLIKAGNVRATVLEVEKDGTLRLQAGIMKTAAKQEDVRLVENEPSNSSVKRIIKESKVKLPPRASAAPSVDLRGMTITEAIDEVENFLDTAMLANLDVVTIIHGKGTGALRAAVQQHLKTMKSVKSFRPGRYGEGEDGVTVVELK
ncbi:MAG: endonuclease MutS2 [Oscillospiraceae bacterium]|nr:endonuclease MutS2 [Oscillospiraceae bacterium]